MRIPILVALTIFVIAVSLAAELTAQGYYTRTATRNTVTGRQQILDYGAPRWSGDGKGGFMFDGASGSLQVTAVRRNRFTGRLEYYNKFFNPWTGAEYTTGTRFNPFTGRYQTLHNFMPPPPTGEGEVAAAVERTLPKRGIRVIETQQPPAEAPLEVNPPLESVEQPPAYDETTETSSDDTTAKPAVVFRFRRPSE